MNVWIPRIIRLIRRYRRMMWFCYRTGDYELYHQIKQDIRWWKRALRREREADDW